MIIKYKWQFVLLAILGFNSIPSIAAETRFCVVNNAGMNIALSAEIDAYDSLGDLIPVGIIYNIQDTPGVCAMHATFGGKQECSYYNEACITFNLISSGYGNESKISSSSSSSAIVLRYHIIPHSLRGNYTDAMCSISYPSEWKFPDYSVATVSVSEGNQLKCEITINPDENKASSSAPPSHIDWSNVPIIYKKN